MFQVLTLLSVFYPTSQTPLPDRVFNPNATLAHQQPNKTVADLVQRQTDTIKQIISNHHRDYPVITKYPADDKQKKNDNLSLEEIKIKCQHLARLATTPPPRNTTSGFYITTDEPPQSTTPKPVPIKYIKLEPVILQKTIMSDGRTIYYWHKSIPSQIAPVSPSTPPPTTTTTTTTTTAPVYNFRNFFPSFYSIGSSESAPATTTEKTTTTEKPDEMQLYQQQLKFVVPVPYAPLDDQIVRKPWEFDQYAYYPKPLQPENVNLQVPYVPTFHVIKAVAVPNQYESGTDGI